jgi:hypothetical protein
LTNLHFAANWKRLELKVRECGVKETEECVLSACEKIPQPIIGALWECMERTGGMIQGQLGNSIMLSCRFSYRRDSLTFRWRFFTNVNETA